VSETLRPIDYLYRGLARDEGAVAIGGPGPPMSYRDLVVAVEALAAAFQSIDARAGSRVGICARNTREHLLALLATYAAGKVWIPLNPRNGRAELDAMIALTQPTMIVADRSCLARFTPTLAPILVGSETAPESDPDVTSAEWTTVGGLVREWSGRRPTVVERAPGDEQIIKFSGGSTGTPKAVVQSVRCLDAQARGLLDFFGFDASDANLIAAPLTHGTSCFVLPILAAGGRHVMLENPRADALVETLEAHAITTLFAPPTMIYSMLAEPSVRGRRYPALRHLIYSAAPMPPARIREAQSVFGPVVETAYGQVEAPQIITALRASDMMDDHNLTSVGRASSVARVAVMSPDGDVLGHDEVGELVVQGPLVMNGYLEQPELSARTIVGGWLHTGDLGLIDDRGFVYIRGRLREMINTGGFKVFPGDVEVVLATHPAVAECCVFGVPDSKWGEAVHAAVCLSSVTPADPEELIAYVKANLDSIKAPKRIHIVADLPRNAVGKVSRNAVRLLVLGDGSRSSS
jgi:fatty-acyl-CoA synthase